MKPKVQATPHESAHLHVSGEAIYVDDIPELAGTLHCALGLSTELTGPSLPRSPSAAAQAAFS